MKAKTSSQSNRPKAGRSALLIISGIILGFIIGYFVFYTTKQTPPKTRINTSAYQQKARKHFINPFSESKEFRSYDVRPIPNLETIINKTVEQQITASNATSIAVYYRDLTNDQVIGVNETEKFSPASLLKVPVLITILKYAEDHPEVLTQTIFYDAPVKAIHKDKPYGISDYTVLIPGHHYSIDKLLEIMIMISDNDATILLLKFIDQQAPGLRESVEQELKLNTGHQDPSTDFVSVKGYSSFFRTLYNASFLNEEMSEKALQILSKTGYGNGIRLVVPKDIVVSQKFGHRKIDETHEQYHHFAIVYHQNKPFLLGIMTKGKTNEHLQSAIASIADTIYKSVDKQTQEHPSYISRDVD